MKKFESLGRSLSKNEQKNIMGGPDEPGGSPMTGRCNGSVGCWTYTEPVTWQTCVNEIAVYCSSGNGSCSAQNLCG